MAFQNPDDASICALLKRVRRVAVVGLSPKADRPSYRVAQALIRWGYDIVPVRPAVESVLGQTAYPDLKAVPGAIDLVDLFRAPDQIGPIIDACIELRVPAIWLQEGVVNEAAALRAQAAGITVIMDRCILKECMRLLDIE